MEAIESHSVAVRKKRFSVRSGLFVFHTKTDWNSKIWNNLSRLNLICFLFFSLIPQRVAKVVSQRETVAQRAEYLRWNMMMSDDRQRLISSFEPPEWNQTICDENVTKSAQLVLHCPNEKEKIWSVYLLFDMVNGKKRKNWNEWRIASLW